MEFQKFVLNQIEKQGKLEVFLVMKKSMMIKKIKIYIVITTIWIAIIFSYSLQPADVSSEMSSGFGKQLVEIFLPNLAQELELMPTEQLEYLHFLLRKCAHFTEYFILGIFVMLSLLKIKVHHKGIGGLIICGLVASIDEMIQLFVSGRSGQISDVVLDSIGALCGICFIIFHASVELRFTEGLNLV